MILSAPFGRFVTAKGFSEGCATREAGLSSQQRSAAAVRRRTPRGLGHRARLLHKRPAAPSAPPMVTLPSDAAAGVRGGNAPAEDRVREALGRMVLVSGPCPSRLTTASARLGTAPLCSCPSAVCVGN